MANRDNPAYECWRAMRRRCAGTHPNYGGRGISVDVRWDSFKSFVEDMGPRPTWKHTIERVNTDGNYEPDNCVWATRGEQSRNRRDARRLNGVPLKTICEERGLKYNTILVRIIKGGRTIEEALK